MEGQNLLPNISLEWMEEKRRSFLLLKQSVNVPLSPSCWQPHSKGPLVNSSFLTVDPFLLSRVSKYSPHRNTQIKPTFGSIPENAFTTDKGFFFILLPTTIGTRRPTHGGQLNPERVVVSFSPHSHTATCLWYFISVMAAQPRMCVSTN